MYLAHARASGRELKYFISNPHKSHQGGGILT